MGQASERLTEDLPPRAENPQSTRLEHDFRIPDSRTFPATPEARATVNIEAIRLLRKLQEENRPATVAEQEVLSRYVGWGAVPQIFAGYTSEWRKLQGELRSLLTDQEYQAAQASTVNAHYTSDQVVDAMWKTLERLGAKPGMSWLEPAVGVGNFFGRQPVGMLEGARRVGIEKDSITGQIAKYLYPDSGIEVMGFEESELPQNYFDAAISNVPFGDFGVYDPSWANENFLTKPIHNYFFAKASTLVRPGGVIAFITSRYTLDGYDAKHTAFRKWLADRVDFLGAVRLPTNTFMENAGTHVITDVIFLRRRLPGAAPAGEKWVEVKDKEIPGRWGYPERTQINEYFHAHPEMILGEEKLSRGAYTANDYTVQGDLTREVLMWALNRIRADGFQDWQPEAEQRKTIALRDLKGVPDDAKLGALFFDKDGNLFRRTSKGSAVAQECSEGEKKRIRGQLQIRDALRALLAAELSDTTDAELDKLRKMLNFAYDRYVKSYGPLSSRANQSALNGDPDAPLLVSLERKFNQRKNTAEKAPIFSRRMLRPAKPMEHVSNSKDALYITINQTGTIDWEHMAKLSGQTVEQLQKDLRDQGLVFQDPETRLWQLAEEYLSGSVRVKLRQARAIAKLDPEFQINVKALEAVQPEDLPPSDIRASLGVTWVPLDIYNQFVKEVLEVDGPVKVKHAGNTWTITIPYRALVSSKWATARVSALDLLTAALNFRSPTVYDRTEDGDVKNVAETTAARDRIKHLHKYFQEWLFSDPERSKRIVRIYNDLHNDLRLRTFDGSHLTLEEMSHDPEILRGGDLSPHQKAAVWRQIAQRNVLLAHAVGAGKTFEMIAAGMELKRLGLISRPMYVVPNETLSSWQQQFSAIYPQKRVIVFSESDLKKENRKRILAQIATGDWDAVVIPHSSFQFLGVGDELFNEYLAGLEKEMDENIEMARTSNMGVRIVKRLEKAKERTITALKNRRKADKKDMTVTWEQLGIDQLFVDESHVYKKLGFTTNQHNIAGIDPNGNQRTFDLLMKVRYTQKHGRGVVFATGTPITNTMGEMFNLMRYLIEPEMQARGIGKFDDWAANFARIIEVTEPKPEGGGYRLKARMAKVVNIPALSTLFRSFADVVTSEMLDTPRPSLAGGERRAIVSELSEDQAKIMEDLQQRAAAIRRNAREALPDNMLAVYTDALKLAMDPRMLRRWAVDNPEGRINQAADEIYRLWVESADAQGVQLVFSDFGVPESARRTTKRKAFKRSVSQEVTDALLGGPLEAEPARPQAARFSVYDTLIQKLVERGIPREQIAHVYQAKNKQQRAELFDRVNAGQVRVILGSTQKMGVGVNVQERAYALHHLDQPHRPADLEQREGRILRQGNRNPSVHIIYYLTKRTLDELRFASLVRKAKFTNDMITGKTGLIESEDVDEGSMVASLEMFQAVSSGDPRVLRKIELEGQIERLGMLHRAWVDQRWQLKLELARLPKEIQIHRDQIASLKQTVGMLDKAGLAYKVGDKSWQGEGVSREVSRAIYDAFHRIKLKGGKDKEPIAVVWGVPVSTDGEWLYVGTNHNTVYGADAEPLGILTKITNFLNSIDEKIKHHEAKISELSRSGKRIEKQLEEPWEQQAELDALNKEYDALLEDLGVTKDGVTTDDPSAVAMEGEEVADASVEATEPEAEGDETEESGEEAETPEAETPTKAPVKRKEGERGSIDVTELGKKLHAALHSNEPARNYSGMGAIETTLRRNLGQIRRASADVHREALRTAGSAAKARAILRTAIPAILDALKGSDYTWPELRLALTESRLRGARDRWLSLAAEMSVPDAGEKLKDPTTFADHMSLLAHIEGKEGLPEEPVETATAIAEMKDWDLLAEFLAETYSDAAEHVASVMPESSFDAVTSDPHVRKALAVYKKLVEVAMADAHARNEGVFSTALGPLDTYYPLSPRHEKPPSIGPKIAFRKPRNPNAGFATGLAEDYDTSMEAFEQKLSRAIRANDRAALIRAAEEVGLIQPAEYGDKTIIFDGVEYTAVKRQIQEARTLIKDGKTIHIPARMGIMPAWFYREIEPILEDHPLKADPTSRIVRALNTFSLVGPLDFIWHTHNILGALVANTPYLGPTLKDKAASAPFLKRFASIVKVLAVDMHDPENLRALQEMAEVGALPSKSGSVTHGWTAASREYAETTGAKIKRFSLSPLLYGPSGLDARARVLMWRIAKDLFPSDDQADERSRFVNQLGNYVPELWSQVERDLKKWGISPFFTAGSTMLVNGINAITGGGPMPKDWRLRRIIYLLTTGAVGTIALWAITYRALTGRWPWQDRRAKLLQIPVGGGNGPIDKYRASKLGKMLWGDDTSEVGYIDFGFFNPIVRRGLRAVGATGYFNARRVGATIGQAAEEGAKDILNSFLHPVAGPAPRAAWVLASGNEPYITSLRDVAGNVGIRFYPAFPSKTKPGLPSAAARMRAAAQELNAFYGDVGVATGFFAAPEVEAKGSKWLRMVTDLTMPGLVARSSNPLKRAQRMWRQRVALKITDEE